MSACSGVVALMVAGGALEFFGIFLIARQIRRDRRRADRLLHRDQTFLCSSTRTSGTRVASVTYGGSIIWLFKVQGRLNDFWGMAGAGESMPTASEPAAAEPAAPEQT